MAPSGDNRMLTGAVIDTLREHTRQTARMLGCLDELRRSTATVLDGSELHALVTRYSERLRTGDGQLQRLLARLEDIGPALE
jgi:hypothetical protein